MENRTGYPSIDKPWLKYYSEEAINAPLPECTMYQYIWENNRDYLGDTALRYYGTKITYGKLFENIKKAAAAFTAMGVKAGDIVTIMSMHTPETIYAIYGLNYIGAVANMVYMTLAEKEILHTLENTESKLFLVLDAALEKVEAIKGQINIPIVVLGVSDSMPLHVRLGYKLKAKPKKHAFKTWTDFLTVGAGSAPVLATDHAAPAVIVYTSGTTGEPKGVVLSSDAINSLTYQYKMSGFNFSRRDSFLFIIPTFLGFGVGMLSIAINAGTSSTLWIELNPSKVAREIRRLRPMHVVVGVAFIDAILQENYNNLTWIKTFAGGGGAVSAEREEEINQCLAKRGSAQKFMLGYGLTETVATVCTLQPNAWREKSVGIPLPYVKLKIVNDEGSELTFDEIGEVCIQAPNVMLEYYNNPQATDAIFKKNNDGVWLRTGDLGYVDEDGFLFITGRLKRVFYRRMSDGTVIRVFPRRIEEFFESLSDVQASAVICSDSLDEICVPYAFLVVKGDSNINQSQILNNFQHMAKENLSDHHIPKHIIILDAMPLTPSGKIDYQALEKLAEEKQ